MSELPPCRGAMNNKGLLVPCSRRGLLAYVYNGVSLTMNVLNALVAGNGSYIVRLSVRDLHGPTVTNRTEQNVKIFFTIISFSCI